MKLIAAAAIAALALASPAHADELSAGLYKHEVAMPWSEGAQTGEGGFDIVAAYRLDPVALGARPYVFASLNTAGDTSFAGAGLAWRVQAGRFTLRPGVGAMVHTGPVGTGLRSDLGSRVLFTVEAAIGYRVTDRLDIELGWMHASHASLFSGRNPGLDLAGLRMTRRF